MPLFVHLLVGLSFWPFVATLWAPIFLGTELPTSVRIQLGILAAIYLNMDFWGKGWVKNLTGKRNPSLGKVVFLKRFLMEE